MEQIEEEVDMSDGSCIVGTQFSYPSCDMLRFILRFINILKITLPEIFFSVCSSAK